MRRPPRKPIALAFVLLLSACALPCGAMAQQEPWDLTYVLRPDLAERRLTVTAVLVGDVTDGVVWKRYGEQGQRSRIETPEAQDAFGQVLRTSSHPQGWSVTGGTSGGMRLNYTVSAPEALPSGTDGLGLGAESLYAPGYGLFLIPESAAGAQRSAIGEIEVIFDIPVSWRTVVPWKGYSRTYRPETADDLWDSLLAAGDFRRHTVRVAGMELQVGIQGRRPGADSTLLEAVRRIILAGQETYGAPRTTSLTLLLPEVAAQGRQSLHLGRSIAIAWQETNASAGSVADLHRLSRELLRIWEVPGGEPDWVSDGMRDYVAWLSLLRQNLISAETFRQEVLTADRAASENPHAADWDFIKEAARTPSSTGAPLPRLSQTRGLVVSLALDATLARKTAGRIRLTDLLRASHLERSRAADAGQPVPLRESDLMRLCAVLTGGDHLEELFDTLVFGTARPPTVEALADILSRERRERR